MKVNMDPNYPHLTRACEAWVDLAEWWAEGTPLPSLGKVTPILPPKHKGALADLFTHLAQLRKETR